MFLGVYMQVVMAVAQLYHHCAPRSEVGTVARALMRLLHNHRCLWLGDAMVTASDLHSTGRGFDSQPFHYQVATLSKLFTHMCLCHQAVQFGTGQRAVMLCGREGNHRSGVELAMRHRL